MTFHGTRRQHGAATLLVTMVFLFSTSLIMLYLNRNILFEQKISANQMRSTIALEMAEAGMEWATGMLNTAYDIDGNCAFTVTANTSFRRKYVQTKWSDGATPTTNIVPATTTYPGCKVNGNVWTCNCPNLPVGAIGYTTATLGSTTLPGFTVSFSSTGDPEAVRIMVTGCTAQVGACTPATAASSDATATISSILKLRPLLRATPAAPLTCGSTCAIGGSFNLKNSDVATGGILANSGTSITGNITGPSIPGQPIANALIENDTSLSTISNADPTCSNSSMFSAYFGSTISQYAASPMVKIIPDCSPANTCGTLVDTAYGAGWRSFYFPDGFSRNNSSGNLGTANDPVTMVTSAKFDVNGSIDIYGMVFSNSAVLNNLGTGASTIHGAMITCAGYASNGNGTLEYDADVLKGVRRSTGILVRVPGSWTDRCTASTAHPPDIICN